MNPIKRYGYIGEGRRAMLRLKQDILDVVMLRRTKVERAEDIKLPPLEINVETLKLNESERDFMNAYIRIAGRNLIRMLTKYTAK